MADARIPVWLDCDPGHDDAFAILLAAYHPRLRLLGISTVFGNASLQKTSRNACSILTAIGQSLSIPVYPGAGRPLARAPIHAPTDIHGESGIDGTSLLPEPLAGPDTSLPALEAMARALRAQPEGRAWLVATGAFTNAAALFQTYPELIPHVAGLSLMGGAVGGGFTPAVMGSVDGVARIGNWTQFAEFNVLADPEAAAWIFETGRGLARKTTLVPLDVTHLVLATEGVQRLLLWGRDGGEGKGDLEVEGSRGAKSTLRKMLVELLFFFAKTYRDVFGIMEGPPLHDPLAVAAVLAGAGDDEIPFYDADPVTGVRERYEVTVITDGTIEEAHAGLKETGRTVVRLLPPGEEGVRIPRGLDIPKFWNVLEECMERADEAVAKPM
ncbi:Inosine/uridine-preferring nucleoside hydrolase [Coniochaeta ligniaria NRRL 30616]|uniref:Inosine/uridine-preferring nucleoside hydrolase n=1 Tax=Coniochaeta ligniaria NRRL 30616 TaxID=1408157 RepID=A0A1J7K038_9PEZI|nr:Inosine/uridine-preferring nucleoside hydrolase [Coniochaeta ligniaria NRRL 30616]